jgi:RNA polymerase sigma-70 factor (ECF subfamily)
MSPTECRASGNSSGASHFLTTHWSVVLSAKNDTTILADAALENLCRAYWWPLYTFARRRGYSPHDAQDLTQEFFERLLEKDFLRTVDRSKGKFRSFLLAASEHFLAKEWRKANAQKRGGKYTFVSINDQTAEEPYLQITASDPSPEKTFERQWATTLLNRAVSRLQEEFVASGKGTLFDGIKVFLTGEKSAYAELAEKHATTEAALKMAVSRMRQRYGEIIREEISNTVSSPEDVEEELRALWSALSS